MTTETDKTDIEAVAALARSGMQVIEHPQGGLAMMRPDGNVTHLPPLHKPLAHVVQTVHVTTADAFVHYVNRFKRGPTTVFAKAVPPKVVGLIDYHDGTTPDRCEHVAVFEPPFSEEWARWRAIDGTPMGQIAFAEFIEENTIDVVEPDGASLLDIVTGLQAHKKVTFESGIRLHDGSNQLTFHEQVEANGRGTIKVPSEFSIGVPVFFGGDAYRVRCMLRYRIDEGKLAFTIRMLRRTFIEQTAFQDVAKAVAEGTGLTVIDGWV